jgi:hypothetical protein
MTTGSAVLTPSILTDALIIPEPTISASQTAFIEPDILAIGVAFRHQKNGVITLLAAQ